MADMHTCRDMPHKSTGKKTRGRSTHWGHAHYVMAMYPKKQFLLAIQLYPQNDLAGWQNGVSEYVCAQEENRNTPAKYNSEAGCPVLITS